MFVCSPEAVQGERETFLETSTVLTLISGGITRPSGRVTSAVTAFRSTKLALTTPSVSSSCRRGVIFPA